MVGCKALKLAVNCMGMQKVGSYARVGVGSANQASGDSKCVIYMVMGSKRRVLEEVLKRAREGENGHGINLCDMIYAIEKQYLNFS